MSNAVTPAVYLLWESLLNLLVCFTTVLDYLLYARHKSYYLDFYSLLIVFLWIKSDDLRLHARVKVSKSHSSHMIR
jgi:hypothetical protein